MPSRLRFGDAVDAGDAVVDGDDQVGLLLRGEAHDFGREAVAGVEAVGHQVVDRGAELRAARAGRRRRPWRRRSRSRRRSGCACWRRWRRPAARRRHRHAVRRSGGSRPVSARVEFLAAGDAARGVEARQQRMHAGLLQHQRRARRHRARDDARHGAASHSGSGLRQKRQRSLRATVDFEWPCRCPRRRRATPCTHPSARPPAPAPASRVPGSPRPRARPVHRKRRPVRPGDRGERARLPVGAV